MVATVKIIPFAVAGDTGRGGGRRSARGGEIFAVNPFRPMRVGVIQTVLPGVKDSVLAKTTRVTEARLARSRQPAVGRAARTPHEAGAVAGGDRHRLRATTTWSSSSALRR